MGFIDSVTVNSVCSCRLSATSYSWRWGLCSWTGRLNRRGVCLISTSLWNWKRRETRSVGVESHGDRACSFAQHSLNILLHAKKTHLWLCCIWVYQCVTWQILLHRASFFSYTSCYCYQALHSRDSLQLEYTDCLLDKNRLRKRIAELQANLEQQQRELERERERNQEQIEQSSPCLHCVS